MTRLFQLFLLLALLCLGSTLALAIPLDIQCDARMVAAHGPGKMTITEYMKVITMTHADGVIDDLYAHQLRMLIEEAYQMPSERALAAWVTRRCAPHDKQ